MRRDRRHRAGEDLRCEEVSGGHQAWGFRRQRDRFSQLSGGNSAHPKHCFIY